MDVSSGGRVRFSPQGWRDYKARCKKVGLTVTDDNKQWLEAVFSALNRLMIHVASAGVIALVALAWQANSKLAVIESKTLEMDRQQDTIISQQDSLERRMDRRESFDHAADLRIDALERAHERAPHWPASKD